MGVQARKLFMDKKVGSKKFRDHCFNAGRSAVREWYMIHSTVWDEEWLTE